MDFDAREAAKDAARRAGQSLGDWLNDVIAEQARESGVSFDDVDEDSRLEAVTARLASMSERGRRSVRRTDEDDDEPPTRRRVAAPRPPRASIRETQFDRRPRHQDDDMRRAPISDPDDFLDAAISAYERGASRGGSLAVQAIDKVERKLEHIEQRLSNSQRQPAGIADEQLARLEARIAALANGGREDRPAGSIRGLERRLEEMADRLEAQRPQPARFEDPAPRDDMVRIETKLNRLIDAMAPAPRRPDVAAPRVAAAAQPGPLDDAISQINRRQRELERGAPANRQPSAGLLDTVLARRQAPAPEPRRPDPALEALRADIARLAERLDANQQAAAERVKFDSDQRPEIDALRQNIDEMSKRLEETHRAVLTRLETPAPAPRREFDQLRQQIDTMSRTLADVAPRDAVASLEQSIRGLNDRVESALRDGAREHLSRPVAELGADLRRALADFAPRRALEHIDGAIRELDAKIEKGRACAFDPSAFAAIQAQTNEIRDMLRAGVAQPAHLEAVERQIANLSARFDRLGQPGADPAALARSIGEVRASLDQNLPSAMIETLAERIDALGRKIDEAVSQSGAGDQLDQISHRLDHMSAALAGRGADAILPPADTSALEKMMRDIAVKLDKPAAAAAEPGAPLSLAFIEDMLTDIRARIDEQAARGGEARGVDDLRDEVSRLTRLIESNAGKSGGEAGLNDVARELARLSAIAEQSVGGPEPSGDLAQHFAALTDRIGRVEDSARAMESIESALGQLAGKIDGSREFALEAAEKAARTALAEALERLPRLAGGGAEVPDILSHELADLRDSQATIDRRTHSTLTAVHETLEKMVDRIALLEDDIGHQRSAPLLASGPAPVFAPAPPMPAPAVEARREPPASKSGAAAQTGGAFSDLSAFNDLIEPGVGVPPLGSMGNAAPSGDTAAPAGNPVSRHIEVARRLMRENASKDAPAPSKRGKSPEAPPVVADAPGDGGRENARARAQAAYNAMMGGGEARAAQKRPDYQPPKTLRGRILGRKYGYVFAGLAGVIVLSLWQLEKRYSPAPPQPVVVDLTKGKGTERAPAETPPADNPAPAPAPAADPAPRQGASLAPPIGPNAPTMEGAAYSSMPMTGRPKTDGLPVSSIGAPGAAAAAVALRSAAEGGNPIAQYELGSRYAEGRTVSREPALALDWFQKAARQNFAPAEYRLGGLYERGVGVTRDLAKARDLYLQAAQAGNVRAMHNLAVLSAEGVDGKPDYAVASRWFREAAEHGVRDSQYNLAILYTRGLGIEQNLVQAWAWFGAAAAQGDADAGKKQIDVGARLDSAQLSAAKAALASFRPKLDDKAANDVSEPQGGWAASATQEPKRSAPARKVSSL